MESVIVGVVGVLQLEVLEQRLESEYHVRVRREGLPYTEIRWIVNKPDEIDLSSLSLTRGTAKVEDMRGNKLLLFGAFWSIKWVADHNPQLVLTEFNERSEEEE